MMVEEIAADAFGRCRDKRADDGIVSTVVEVPELPDQEKTRLAQSRIYEQAKLAVRVELLSRGRYDTFAMKLRHVIAQAVILVHWALDWVIFGTHNIEAAPQANEAAMGLLSNTFITLSPLYTVPAAIVVGLIDGAGREGSEAIRTGLVVGFAAFVSFLGLGLPELLGGGYARPVESRLILLASMEALLLLELGIAASVSLLLRMRPRP